jgi:Zn-dependent protease with chaperone function
MIIALLLAGYALATLTTSPVLLTRGSWRVHHPRLCLSLWYLVFLTGVAAAVGSGAVGVWLGWQIQVDGDTLAASFGFGSIDGLGPVVRVLGGVLGWSTLAVGGALVSLVATRAQGLIVAQRRIRSELDTLVARAGYRRELIAGMPVTYVTSARPIACTLGGRAGGVIVSSDLDLSLSAAELRAVIEHERAHLHGAHALLSRLALLNQACLPASRAARELSRATALLIELIADDVAARRAGGTELAAALTKIGQVEQNPTLGLRALRIRQRLAVVA